MREEKKNNLLKQLKEHKPVNVYLNNEFYDKFYYQNGIYQGKLGYLTLDNLLNVLNGKLDFIRIEVSNE